LLHGTGKGALKKAGNLWYLLNGTGKGAFKKADRKAGKGEGRQEGIEQERRAWEAWNQRRMQAEANGEPFDEAPPSQRHSSSDSNGKNS
jgi:hypothetical protein